ncbi:hypothetical protein FOMPIDRAFT_1017209 [Fomitopsis schrenkii]|uniref:Uncharacterized protein n=1 Tax=Fomitopsis schrenkii TaxID=2126942 RepID=S8FLY7_FOMSC|nr:hypothetical protein FOMPIDRAFT_1017209 [Fomitopsis schrenkii]
MIDFFDIAAPIPETTTADGTDKVFADYDYGNGNAGGVFTLLGHNKRNHWPTSFLLWRVEDGVARVSLGAKMADVTVKDDVEVRRPVRALPSCPRLDSRQYYSTFDESHDEYIFLHGLTGEHSS